jgi:uncharacterized LabA/DUF88 family protein
MSAASLARSTIHVDGFNLYYGALKGTKFKWLNIEHLFRRIRQHDKIQRIYYYTAQVDAPQSADQEAYLAALSTRKLITIVEGRFKTREVRCRVKACNHGGSRMFRSPEEKRTDVNIALQMLEDAYQDRADRIVLVSGDSDLVPVVEKIKEYHPKKKVILYVPAPARMHVRARAKELRAAVDKHSTLIPSGHIKFSQFPDEVPDGEGGIIARPRDW